MFFDVRWAGREEGDESSREAEAHEARANNEKHKFLFIQFMFRNTTKTSTRSYIERGFFLLRSRYPFARGPSSDSSNFCETCRKYFPITVDRVRKKSCK